MRKLLNAITIVGMGNEEFANALAGIQEIHRVAQNTWPGLVEDYYPDIWMGYPAITIANPVFSPKPGDLDIASVSFLPGEDPKGSLAEALRNHSSHIRHLDENVVHYLFVKNRNTKP